jgi:hypothetical protein
MSTKSRQVIYGGRIKGAEIRAERAREAAKKAIREADRAEAEAWSIRIEGIRRAGVTIADDRAMSQRRPGWLEVECRRCKTRAAFRAMPFAGRATRRYGSLKPLVEMSIVQERPLRSPVRMIRLTETQEITPYKWVHPDEER